MAHRVLVVDDEAGVRALLEDQLGRLGLEVHSAAHGEQGLALFQAIEPHLVILDFLTPRRNGFGVAEAIRRSKGGAATPILMMSGVFKNPKTALEARQKYQVVDFLSKPIDPERLEAAVLGVLKSVPEGPSKRAVNTGSPPGGGCRSDPSPATPEEAAGREDVIVDGVYMGRPIPALEEEGDLARTPVAQILSALRLEHATGMLDLTDHGIHRRVYVIEGRPTFMQSNAEGENVGVLLLGRGRITEQDFNRCRRHMLDHGRTLQQSLLHLKLVNEVELSTAYRLLAGQLLPLGVGMSAGRYHWRDTDAFVGRVPEGRFDPLEVLFQGIRRNVHPPHIFEYFRGKEDLPIYPSLLWGQLQSAFHKAFPSAEALLRRINGQHTFRVLSRAPEFDSASAMPSLFALVTSGMAVLPPEAPRSSVEVRVDEAASLSSQGLGSGLQDVDRSETADTLDPQESRDIEVFHDDLLSQNFFEIFGVAPGVEPDPDKVKSAYFELAKRWHIDSFAGRELGPSKAIVEEIFARITEAYETISDPNQREEYRLYLDRKAKGLPTDVSEILRGEQLFDQATAMIRRRDHRGAQEVLEEAVRLNPDPLYFATLGWVVYRQAPKDEDAVTVGISHLHRAVQEQENLPIAYQYLGTIAFQRNRYAEARKWWKRCIQWEPSNIDANRGLRMIAQRSQGTPGRAGILERFRGKKT